MGPSLFNKGNKILQWDTPSHTHRKVAHSPIPSVSASLCFLTVAAIKFFFQRERGESVYNCIWSFMVSQIIFSLPSEMPFENTLHSESVGTYVFVYIKVCKLFSGFVGTTTYWSVSLSQKNNLRKLHLKQILIKFLRWVSGCEVDLLFH